MIPFTNLCSMPGLDMISDKISEILLGYQAAVSQPNSKTVRLAWPWHRGRYYAADPVSIPVRRCSRGRPTARHSVPYCTDGIFRIVEFQPRSSKPTRLRMAVAVLVGGFADHACKFGSGFHRLRAISPALNLDKGTQQDSDLGHAGGIQHDIRIDTSHLRVLQIW